MHRNNSLRALQAQKSRSHATRSPSLLGASKIKASTLFTSKTSRFHADGWRWHAKECVSRGGSWALQEQYVVRFTRSWTSACGEARLTQSPSANKLSLLRVGATVKERTRFNAKVVSETDHECCSSDLTRVET
eukprot:3080986-Pleurochrysis_carterae.AAC.3